MSHRSKQWLNKKKWSLNISNPWFYNSSVILWIYQSNDYSVAILSRIQSEAQETSCISVCKWRSCIKLYFVFSWSYDCYFSEGVIREVIISWFIVPAGSARKNIEVSNDIFKPGITLMKSYLLQGRFKFDIRKNFSLKGWSSIETSCPGSGGSAILESVQKNMWV